MPITRLLVRPLGRSVAKEAKREAAQAKKEVERTLAELETARREAAAAKAVTSKDAAKRKDAEFEASRMAAEFEEAKKELEVAKAEVIRISLEAKESKREVAQVKEEVARKANELELTKKRLKEVEPAQEVAGRLSRNLYNWGACVPLSDIILTSTITKVTFVHPVLLQENTLAGLTEIHQPDLGQAVTTLVDDVEKIAVSLYNLQKSRSGPSIPSSTNGRKEFKAEWEMLRAYLQRCHSFGADVLTLKDALQNPDKGDLAEFLGELAASAKEVRQLSGVLKSRDISRAFSDENQSDESANAVRFLPSKGRRKRHKSRIEIYDALARIKQNTDTIFEFWDRTADGCSLLLDEFNNDEVRMENTDAEEITSKWKGYQEAIREAIASITKACDAILVEAEGAPTVSRVISASVAGEGDGAVKKNRFSLGEKLPGFY